MRVAARTPARGGLSSTTALCGLLGATLLAHGLSGPASAADLPQGGTVAAGSASFSQSGQSLTVNQSSDRAVINWQSFGIGVDANVRFQQPSSNSITLNRVTGGERSDILGTLSANGSVWILNPNGILFGSTARVDTAGLVATTSNITDSDFMAGKDGKFAFSKSPGSTGSVVNEGTITIQGGGLAALVAPSVRNSGVISANLGRVALAAGDAFTVDFYGDKLIQFALPTGASPDVDVTNSGTIRADGGHVQISAATAAGIVSGVVNMTGIVEARRVGVEDGVIVLDGGEAGAVTVAGTLDASGRDAGRAGGTVKVLGDQVALTGSAKIDASGDAGGGTVLVGGNYQGKGPERNARTTTIAAGATLKADAVTNGNGGTVVAWADGNTRFDGRITARGGAQGGNGGLVETSGKAGVSVGATAVVDASAPAGQGGTWLLDPTNLTIKDGESTNEDDLKADGDQFVDASVIETSLHRNMAVTLQALNTITIDEAINGNSGSAGANSNLTLEAQTVNLNAAITLHSSATLSGNATQVNVGSGGRIQNGVDVAGNGATVNIDAGIYNENVTISKRLTLNGAQAGVRGDATTRTSEAGESTITGITTINAEGQVVVDGFRFFDNYVNEKRSAVRVTNLSGTPTIRNSIFERSATTDGVTGSSNQRGIEISPSATGGIIIEDNLFTSDEVNVWANRGWKSAIWSNGGGNNTIIRNNVFENSRTAINFDNFSNSFTVTGNSFSNNGTANAFGGTTPTAGSFTIAGNDYSGNWTDFNLSNVASTFRLDATGNTFNGKAASAMSKTELFALEDRIVHGLDTGKNGLVTVVENNVYVTKNSGSIQRGINYVAEGGTVNVEEGAYAESLTINKALTLDGAGSDNTRLVSSAAGVGTGIVIGASDVTVRNLEISGYNYGVELAGTTEDVTLAGLALSNNRYGVRAGTGAKTSRFTMRDSTITGGTIGVIKENGLSSGQATGWFSDALFEDVSISGASYKGMYFESAENLTLRDVKIADSGNDGDDLRKYGHGIDINLKYDDFGTITLDNVIVSNSGESAGDETGAAVVIKTRGGAGDSSTYQQRAATLEAVNIIGGRIEGTSGQGLRVEDLASLGDGQPTVTINGTQFANNGMDIVVGRTNVNAVGATFVGAANGFAIEDRVFHALDNAGLGVVRFDANNVYVTRNSGSIQRGLDAANAGDTVRVGAGEFNEDLSVSKDVSVVGSGTGSTTIKPKTDTTAFNLDASSGWITVEQGVEFNLSDVTLDGADHDIYHGILHRGRGVIDNVAFRNIRYDRYYGIAVRVLGGPSAGAVDITNSTFANIGRIGAHFGDASTGSFIGNVYTGKGDGDHLDYGVEVGRGGKAVIRNNTITNNTGVAKSDGSTSAGILVTTYYPPAGTQATIENNFINGNTVGVHVGYDRNDRSMVTVAGNDLSGNTKFAIVSTRPVVFAPFNWYGATTPAGVQAQLDGPVVFIPFLTSGVDISSASGFQGNPSAKFPRPSQAPPTPPGLSNQTPPSPPSPGTNPGGVAFNGDLTSQPVGNVFGQGFGLGGAPVAPPQNQGNQGAPTIPGNPVPGGNIVSGAPEPVGGPSGQRDPSADHANQYANSLLDNFAVGSGDSSNDSE